MKSEGQKQSLKHEKRLAKKVGGGRNAGSGAFWQRKGDVRSKDLLIEHKWTGKQSFTMKADVENYVVLLEDDFLQIRDTLLNMIDLEREHTEEE